MGNADKSHAGEHDHDENTPADPAAAAGSESQQEGEAAMDAAEDAVVDHGQD